MKLEKFEAAAKKKVGEFSPPPSAFSTMGVGKKKK